MQDAPVVLSAYRLLHEILRVAVILVFVGVLWALRFLGIFRSSADPDSDRDLGSIALRLLAAIGVIIAAAFTAELKSDVLVVATANPQWGIYAGLVLLAGIGFLVIAIPLHFIGEHHHYDILDASEDTRKASARLSHWEDVEANVAMVWIFAFGIAVFWLFEIARGR
jgi:hypothetical protein